MEHAVFRSTTTRAIGLSILALAMALFVVAGAAKLTDLPEFLRSLESWKWIPGELRLPLAVGVPTVEFLVGGLWLAKISRRRTTPIALCLAAGILAVTGVHAALDVPPDCKCFGVLEQYFSEQTRRAASLWKSGTLAAMLLLGTLLFREDPAGRPGNPQPDANRSPKDPVPAAEPDGNARPRRAFTLVELLLVLLIVALLAALLVPALRGARSAGLDARTLSNLRSSMAIFDMYANDWRDAYLCFADPHATTNIIRRADGSVFTFDSYFTQVMIWSVALADAYYEGNARHRSVYPAEAFAGPYPRRGPFVLTCTLFTHPDFWREETRTGLDQFRGSRRSDVQFPSDKSVVLDVGFLLNNPPPPGNARVRVAQADGSALGAPADSFPRGYHQGEVPYRGWLHTMDFPVARHTIGGMRGRDRP